MNNSDPALGTAIDAVAAACGVARAVQGDLDRVRQITKDDRSPVTVADFAVQAIIVMALRTAFGEVLIAGEERADRLRTDEHAGVRDAVIEVVRTVQKDVTADEVLAASDSCDHDAPAEAYWTLDPIDGAVPLIRPTHTERSTPPQPNRAVGNGLRMIRPASRTRYVAGPVRDQAPPRPCECVNRWRLPIPAKAIHSGS